MGSLLDEIRRWMLKFYWAVEPIITPGLNNSQLAYKEKLTSFVTSEKDWLDLGCGHNLLPEWMPEAREKSAAIVARARRVIGIDRDFSSLRRHNSIEYRVCGEVSRLPFRDEAFNLVTANMVVEHLEGPAPVLSEIARILKGGGIFLFHTPNRLGYSSLIARIIPRKLVPRFAQFLLDRKAEDVYPTFYRLNTFIAIDIATQAAGLHLVECTYLESSAQARMLGPFVIFELLLIRLLRVRTLARLRTNIIAVLEKPHAQSN